MAPSKLLLLHHSLDFLSTANPRLKLNMYLQMLSTKPAPTNTGSATATSSLAGAAAVPDAQYPAFFALALAIFGTFTLGLGL